MNRKRYKAYDRVMPRVYNNSRTSLRSGSVVTRHEGPSSVRLLGAKVSGSNLSGSAYCELPVVLDEYKVEESVQKCKSPIKSRVVKPKKTLKSLDTSKSPPRLTSKAGETSRSLKAQESTPALKRDEEWPESHYRKCLSSRSHERLKEIKDEIQAYHETEKLLHLRSRLYKKCGIVFDDHIAASDKAVQAEVKTENEPEEISRQNSPQQDIADVQGEDGHFEEPSHILEDNEANLVPEEMLEVQVHNDSCSQENTQDRLADAASEVPKKASSVSVIEVPGFSRVSSTSTYCVIAGCNVRKQLHRICVEIRTHILAKQCIYIPKFARCCEDHLRNSFIWRDFANCCRPRHAAFNSTQLANMFKMLQKGNSFLDFDSISKTQSTARKVRKDARRIERES